jgi:hypothetical protein
MKKLLLLFLLSSTCLAAPQMSHEEVVKQFNEPGHIPQGLNPVFYNPLDVVISKPEQKKIKAAKKVRSKQIKRAKWEEYFKRQPDGSDFRPYDIVILNQWNGTCTGHAAIGGIENLLSRDGIKEKLSERFLWSTYHQYSSHAAMKALLVNHQVSDSVWPHAVEKKPKEVDFKSVGIAAALDIEYLGSDPAKAIEALLAGYPVNVAMSVPRDMAACRATVRASAGTVNGGHAMAIVGVKFAPDVEGGVYTIHKQSWGSKCGNNGYQFVPIVAYCERPEAFCDFWALKKAARVKEGKVL